MTVLIIAATTLRELARSRLFYNLLVFALLLIVGSLVLASLTIGQWERVITDTGLATIHAAGTLIAVLVGISLVAGEMERRTLYVILAKPVGRFTFMLGRYLGLAVALAINVFVMGLAVVLLLKGTRYEVVQAFWPALFLVYVELLVLSAFALVFSSFSSVTLSAIFTFGVFLIGHLSADLRFFGSRSPSAVGRAFSEIVYRALPNLELLNLKAQAANALPVTAGAVASAAAYGLAYAAAALCVAGVIFQRRDLR